MAGRQFPHRNERGATREPARTWLIEGLTAAATAAIAFLCYYGTLLPGLDLGDSASFQTGAGSLTLTPRQAYPLYYGLGSLFVWLHGGEPARAMNLASAVYGCVAVGLTSWLASRLTESVLAGAAAGLFLAFSYTFWSQAITAEVYTLHLLFAGASMLAAAWWAERPTVGRLALFYAVYAIGFGNHLSMILLLPPFAVFLLLSRRRDSPSDPLRFRMIALALAIAVAAALQYAWNFRGMWTDVEPPSSFLEGVAKFWFDVTKADWRESLVMTVSQMGRQTRPAMYWFDLRQQFGVPGVLLASIGIAYVTIRWPRRGVLLLLVYASNLAFAWTYNVGDAYIFFLPSHYVVAVCAGAGIGALVWSLSHLSARVVATSVGALCLVYPAWRGYDTFPAVDRSWDRRADELLDQFTATPGVYGVDMNWQLQNAFEYFMERRRPHLPWFHTEELEWLGEEDGPLRFEEFVSANADAGRNLIVGPDVISRLKTIDYRGPFEADDRAESFERRVRSASSGTPYVLAVLRPDREYPIDTPALHSAWTWLVAGTTPLPAPRQFSVVIGRVGQAPILVKSEDRPYRLQTALEPFQIDVRMESWLPTDTIRRAGFGHVIVDRDHLLTLERGVSFAAWGPAGASSYSSGIYAPIPRYILGLRPPR
jgi:Protein of unknown function (DUF2723)